MPPTGRCLDLTNIMERRKSLCSWVAVVVEGGCSAPAYTDISYVVPPTPVTFLTLLWRLGLRVVLGPPVWQSICPLTFMASLSGKRRTKKIIQHKEPKKKHHKTHNAGCGSMHIGCMEDDCFK